ncbi:MAG: hypothetical protein PF505_06605 [Vallitaleaceae bacterium]|jgi:hypothetical protein|nr:hypothetical protein [Vallitaleaceae bacterium]
MHILAIEVSTSSAKTIIYQDGAIIASKSIAFNSDISDLDPTRT